MEKSLNKSITTQFLGTEPNSKISEENSQVPKTKRKFELRAGTQAGLRSHLNRIQALKAGAEVWGSADTLVGRVVPQVSVSREEGVTKCCLIHEMTWNGSTYEIKGPKKLQGTLLASRAMGLYCSLFLKGIL